MLATSADVLPRGDGWSYEFKWDGVRALYDAGRLYSRAGNDITLGYPELSGLVEGDVLLDGEIVAFVDGRPSFEALQERMHVRGKADVLRLAEKIPVTYMVFDVLRLDGTDLTGRPLLQRRELLDDLQGITVSPSFDDGPATEKVARESGLEGVVAKRSTSRYRPGLRTNDWVKLRFVHAGDFAVIGWEAPHESPDTLSSLVVASWRDGELQFAGKAGSGLTGRVAGALQKRMHARKDSAVRPVPPASPGRVTHWVDPEVVVEVRYTLVTNDGRLRQPVFVRVRDDKTVDEANG
jgi:bifunctional non-homologous end joining protein LigD